MAGPIVITGGGTGGHVFPMQAIAEQLLARGVAPEQLRFVGSRRGQEAALLEDSGVSLTLLPGRGLQRSWSLGAGVANVGACAGLLAALVVALARVGRWRPSVVVSVGGYASFAVSFAAVFWRRPLVLVELDATSGAAHRLLGRFATRHCTAFPSNDPHSVVTGAPLRDVIVELDRSRGARVAMRAGQRPPIEASRHVVVVMTGSLGARSVNRAVTELARLWSDRRDVTLVHVTGRRDFDRVVSSRPTTTGLDYRVEAFGDMAMLWTVCDVALCRAGATTVAELCALGIPAILVPLPGAPGDHQTLNARTVVAAGGARLVRDDECHAPTLAAQLDEMFQSDTLASMSAAAASLGRRDAAAAIAREVCDVAGLS